MPALRTASRLVLAADAAGRPNRAERMPREDTTAPGRHRAWRRAWVLIPTVAAIVAAGVAALPGLPPAHPLTASPTPWPPPTTAAAPTASTTTGEAPTAPTTTVTAPTASTTTVTAPSASPAPPYAVDRSSQTFVD